MKMKISVFALLLSFLIALVPPSSARADDSITTLCVEACEALTENSELYSSITNGSSYVIGYSYDNKQVEMLIGSSTRIGYLNNSGVYLCNNYNSAVSASSYKYENGEWVAITSGVVNILGQNGNAPLIVASSFNMCVNLTEYNDIPTLDEYLSENTYTFIRWCSDAGLNCTASSNEIEELYDFSFNPEDYYYIVRRNRIAGSRYSLCLSQVTKKKDLIYYSTNRVLADSTIGAAALFVLSGESVSGSTHIRNYVYDSSGGGWLYTDNYSVDLGFTNDYFVDDIGISFSSSFPIVFSSTDIYSDKEQSSVYYAADTEFKDPFVLYPIISPTPSPTPTTAPGSGSGSSGGGRPGSGTRPDTGGQATGGGGLDFIINLFTMIWIKICSIPMAVDGYSISLQQIIVYGALVSIVGGFIMHFIFGRK